MLACERDEPTVYLLRWWAGEHSDSATMMSLLYPRRVDFCAELRSLPGRLRRGFDAIERRCRGYVGSGPLSCLWAMG